MQNKIALDPNYKGPLIVEEYLRKMKSQSSLARMISTYNRRFFVLDFKRMIFYYLPEKGSQLSNAQDIPLDSITRIYLDAQLQLLEEGHHWKHGFVILCGKRSYKLISHSQNGMENLLYGFAHIINTETKKPLFDWDLYKYKKDAPRFDTEPQMPQTISLAVETPTPAVAQANPVVKKKSSQERRVNEVELERADSSDKGRQEIPEGPIVEEPPLVIKKENSPQKTESLPQGADVKKKKPLEQRNEEQNNPLSQKLNVREVDSVDVCESQIIMANESVHANVSELEQQVSSYPKNEGRRAEKNKIEIMTIDPVESSDKSLSERNVINRRLVHQDSLKNSGWGQSPKSGQLRAQVHKSSEERYETKADTNTQPHSSGINPYSRGNSIKQQIGQDQDNDWDNVPVKKDNVYKVQAKVEEVDDWDVESPPKKNNAAKVQQQEDDDDWDKDMNYSPPKNTDKSRNVAAMKTNATKKVDHDDDWDKDMFDDHKPQNNRFAIRTESKYTVQNSGYSSSAGGFGMPTKTVAVAKGKVHNDWDDDL